MTATRPDLRRLLGQPAYRRLWVARTMTGSGLGVSGAVLAEIAPVLLLGPLAGSLVDRLPRVKVMVVADLARVLLTSALVACGPVSLIWPHRDGLIWPHFGQ